MWILIFRPKTRVEPRPFSSISSKIAFCKVVPYENSEFSLKTPQNYVFHRFYRKITLLVRYYLTKAIFLVFSLKRTVFYAAFCSNYQVTHFWWSCSLFSIFYRKFQSRCTKVWILIFWAKTRAQPRSFYLKNAKNTVYKGTPLLKVHFFMNIR